MTTTFQTLIEIAIATDVGFAPIVIDLTNVKVELELDCGNGFLPTPEIIVSVTGSVGTPDGIKHIYLPLKWSDVSDQIDQTLTDAVTGKIGPHAYAS
jgi:hypothetical protein